MNNDQLLNYGRGLIYYAVKHNRDEVISLLKKNGVNVPDGIDDKALHFMVIKTMIASASFLNDFEAAVNKRAGGGANAAPLDKPMQHTTASQSRQHRRYMEGAASYGNVTGALGIAQTNAYKNDVGDTPPTSDTTGTNPDTSKLGAIDIFSKSLDLAIAYFATKGNKGINDEVNNAEAVARAKAAAEAAAKKRKAQTTTLVILSLVAVTGVIVYAKMKKSPAA